MKILSINLFRCKIRVYLGQYLGDPNTYPKLFSVQKLGQGH